MKEKFGPYFLDILITICIVYDIVYFTFWS